jgi:indolepyruvate decarboxylase
VASLAEFLFTVLRDQGVKHCFGLPGDYVLPLYKELENIQGIGAVVGTHEPCAAFSADAYARLNGLGVLVLTYGVGVLNAMNGIACAYAESSPVLIISGAPPTTMQNQKSAFGSLLHHMVKDCSSQLQAVSHIVEQTYAIANKESAAEMIVKAIQCTLACKRPVYLEIPTDLMAADIPVPKIPAAQAAFKPKSMQQGVDYFLQRIQAAQRPVLQIGVEISRWRLQEEIKRLINKSKIPYVLTPLGKGALSENHPLCYGVYAGVLSPNQEVRSFVEQSDLVISLGARVTDVNCGAFTADLKQEKLLIAKTGYIGDGFTRLADSVQLDDFIRALVLRVPENHRIAQEINVAFDYRASHSLMDQYLNIINTQLTEPDLVIADTGDVCYGSLFLKIKREDGYLAPLFYNSMGFAVPAALGAMFAKPDARPIVLVGDGSFQMTGTEISTFVRYKLAPIILVFNNNGFGMQRIFQDGSFNTPTRWNYRKITDLIGGGKSWLATNPQELESAINSAREHRAGPAIIEVLTPQGDISTPLRLFSEAAKREKTGLCPSRQDGTVCEHSSGCAFCRAAIWSK